MDKYQTRIREGAIKRAKKRLAMEGVPPEAITREEKEAIVAEEEAKIKATYRDLSIGALISALTFGSF